MSELIEHRVSARGLQARILGPSPAPISKLRGKFRFHILLQSIDPAHLGDVIRRATESFTIPDKEDVQYVIDIDPLDML